jgi:hypothetical protein
MRQAELLTGRTPVSALRDLRSLKLAEFAPFRINTNIHSASPSFVSVMHGLLRKQVL